MKTSKTITAVILTIMILFNSIPLSINAAEIINNSESQKVAFIGDINSVGNKLIKGKSIEEQSLELNFIDNFDCKIYVIGGNKYKSWRYDYTSYTPLAMGSSEQMGAVIMKNTKSTFNAMIQVGVATDYTNNHQSNEEVGWRVSQGALRLWTNRHIFTDIK